MTSAESRDKYGNTSTISWEAGSQTTAWGAPATPWATLWTWTRWAANLWGR